jgi:hypothetical protein
MFKIFDSLKEAFDGSDNKVPVLILLIILSVVLQLLLSKYLWNNFLVRLVPVVQPAKGLLDILAISLLFRMLFG